MKIRKLLLLLGVFTTVVVISQTKSLDSAYTTYFKNNREIPYVHLNKTSYLRGEEVWFKAYVLNLNTKKLHRHTTNLYCTIYDDKGVYKDHKLLFVKNGIANGSFKLDSTFTNRNYYVEVATNYMKNFKENETYLQKITIVSNEKNIKDVVVEDNSYDLQVLPEGGHLLSNSLNSLGIIIKDKNGDAPKRATGEIVDEDGNVEERFLLNRFGLAKVLLNAKKGKQYSVNVRTNSGEIVTKRLPGKSVKGVTLAFEDISSNMAKFIVNTNEETLDDLIGKKYYILIHNTNSFIKRTIEFKSDLLSYSLFIKKKLFEAGTNIVTLFNEANKPIVERVFFNYDTSLVGKVAIDVKDTDTDSTTVSFNKKNDTISYFLSASVLPNDTKAYHPSQTIYSKFFLQPYIKGEVKNSAYFFKDVNRKKLQELDLVLLTQGWSKYKWFDIFNTPPKTYYEFEKGISIKGTINMKDINEGTEVYLLGNSNRLLLSNPLKNNTVTFNNLYLKDKDTINLSFLDKKNKLQKVKAYFQNFPLLKKNNIKVSNKEYGQIRNKKKESELVLADNFVSDEFEFLNEVEVKAALKNNPKVFGNATGYKIDDTYHKYGRILDFIRTKGFRVYETPRFVVISNITAIMSVLPFNMYFNGIRITDDPSRMLSLRDLKNIDVDEIYISNSFGGEIHIYTTAAFNYGTDLQFLKHGISNGFSLEKEFYQPKYASTQSKIFKSYGSLHWSSNIILQPDATTKNVKISHLNQNEIKVIVEGISSRGELIHQIKTFKNVQQQIE